MITWTRLTEEVPLLCREIIAKNEDKEVYSSSSAKKSKVMKFAGTFTKDQVLKTMQQDGITHWSYIN